jgi:hypothetical protein
MDPSHRTEHALQVDLRGKPAVSGPFAEPSDGLEPSIPWTEEGVESGSPAEAL